MYNHCIPDSGLTPDEVKRLLRAAEERKAQALAEYEAASAEVSWLQKGLRIFDPNAVVDEGDAEAVVTELFPEGFFFETAEVKPTLRQAIVVVMREHPGRAWTVTELAQELNKKSWLPEQGAKRVSDMAGDMVRLRQLVRRSRGVYVLSPELAAALDAAPGFKK